MTTINGTLTVTLKDGIPFLMDGTRIVAKVFGDKEFAQELADRYNNDISEVQEGDNTEEELIPVVKEPVEENIEAQADTPNADPDLEEKSSE